MRAVAVDSSRCWNETFASALPTRLSAHIAPNNTPIFPMGTIHGPCLKSSATGRVAKFKHQVMSSGVHAEGRLFNAEYAKAAAHIPPRPTAQMTTFTSGLEPYQNSVLAKTTRTMFTKRESVRVSCPHIAPSNTTNIGARLKSVFAKPTVVC